MITWKRSLPMLLVTSRCYAFLAPKDGMGGISTRQSDLLVEDLMGYCNAGRNVFVNTKFAFVSKRKELRMTGDDDEMIDEPLAKGVDSVSWLPSVHSSKEAGPITGIKQGREILPLFPLGGIVYTPNTEHVLNIFEPRYRQMYNDILMNGSKRFVVSMSHPTEQGRFAEVGVLFELQDLKEVSEQTKDRIKYICNHKVTGRVRLHNILNPSDWESRETYLKVEGTLLDKDGVIEGGESSPGDEGSKEEEEALRASFKSLVDLQHETQQDVRFTLTAASSLAVSSGEGEDSLWATIRLWQSYTEQRLVSRQNELQKEFQDKLIEFLMKDKGVGKDQLPSAIDFNDLSPDLQQEMKELQKRMTSELKPLYLESTLTMQKILEAKDHVARLQLIRFFIDAERKRVEVKRALKQMFVGIKEESESKIGDLEKENVTKLDDLPSSSTFFTDDPEAFQ